MADYKVDQLHLFPEVIRMAPVPPTPDPIPLDAITPAYSLIRHARVVDAINSTLDPSAQLEHIAKQMFMQTFTAANSKAAVDAASHRFAQLLSASVGSKTSGAALELDAKQPTDITYIPVSPTKHLKSSALIYSGTYNGIWRFENIVIRRNKFDVRYTIYLWVHVGVTEA